MPTREELTTLQSLPLEVKIKKTEQRIKEWVEHYGIDGVYVSFSGGKDSTVLLDIARKIYPNIRAMFVDVPTQFPELRQFVSQFSDVDWVKPDKNFFQVCEEYGFPIFSKEVSETVYGARRYLQQQCNKNGLRYSNYIADIYGVDRRENKNNPDFIKLKYGIDGEPVRLQQLEDVFAKKNGQKSLFNKEKYKFMLKAPFEISNKCCNIMKKKPAHEYMKKTGRVPITAQMTDESNLRQQKWLQNGCNAFDNTYPSSNPMSFWKEQDVLHYILKFNIPICSVYGDIVQDYEGAGLMQGQCSLFEQELPLKTTGYSRTGCVLCGFGCHLEKSGDERFVKLKETHPKMYKMIEVTKNNGITYKEALDWINENNEGQMNIKY